jgi:Bacterial Ig domain
VTLSNTSLTASFSAALFVAGYRLFLLSNGVNSVSATLTANVLASNTLEGTYTESLATSVQVTIIDPTPTNRSSGDESALPLDVTLPLQNSVWTPTGGSISFTQGTFIVDALIGGTLPVTLGPCNPTTGLTGCDGTGANCTGYTPDPNPDPFESTTVNAPPTAPTCSNESVIVGAGQSVNINLADNCSDVNGNLDPNTFSVSALLPNVGTLTPNGGGSYTYNAPATDPGSPVTFTFTVADTGGLVSAAATVSIQVLANSCDATTGSCSLTEIIVQPVIGTTMTLDKADGVVMMTPVVLNGDAQVSTGAIQPLTITNARGTSAGWTVTGYATDIGTAGSPTIEPLPGVVIPFCDRSNPGANTGNYTGTSYDRRCIPGDNLAWGPSSQIVHDIIAGDVAQVFSGPAQATSAADWRAQLVAAGRAGVNGLGGLLEQNVLCSSPADHSGGTYQCDAALYLGVPATAAAGTYTGGIVLTLT